MQSAHGPFNAIGLGDHVQEAEPFVLIIKTGCHLPKFLDAVLLDRARERLQPQAPQRTRPGSAPRVVFGFHGARFLGHSEAVSDQKAQSCGTGTGIAETGEK